MKKVLAEPKVSIIVPVYNTAKYLPACIESLIGQTYQNLEIILVDDGATDDSGKIADEYAKKDTRIKVVHQKNGGQSAARNRGLEIASGDFVGFIDSDDEADRSFVEKTLAPYLNSEKTCLTVCGLQYHWLKSGTKQDVFLKPLRQKKKNESKAAYILYLLAIDGRIYSSFNKLYKKEFLDGVTFDKTLNFAEDTKFVLDYIKNLPEDFEIGFVLEPLCFYNYGTENSTMRKTATVWANWQKSYANLKKWVGSKPSLRERFWLRTVYARWHISYLRSKRRTK